MRRALRAGFTLIELLVVSAIIIILTMVLLLRQSSFDSSTILRSVAYSVALSVRQAQVYGTSVLGSASGGSVKYASAYGLYFSNSTPTSYVLFADFNNNGVYDPSTETIKVFTLNSGYTLYRACGTISAGVSRCTNVSGPFTMGTSAVTILFRRPNPDAVFKTDTTSETYVSAWIEVQSPSSTKRAILVTAAGQISVQVLGATP
ncbi:MAG TPA: type II secretion system protein [Candidatus Paceibacterota bacterium]|nr:type II secretion system protein [Candidatus Paceibacterota bacterium]